MWTGRLLILALVVMAPWWYGSVSQRAQSVLLALGIGALGMGWFSMIFGGRGKHILPFLALPVILGVILVGCQMLPLSESVGDVIASRQSELYARYASPADGELLQEVANPIAAPVRLTMYTDGTAKMFNLLVLALVCLITGCQFFSSRRAIFLLPVVMTLNGMAISCYGIVQKIRGETSIYGIELSQGGVPFGPFVNRNNAAGYLLICLAASLALIYGAFHRKSSSRSRPRQIVTNEYPFWQRAYMHIGLFFAELNALKLAAMLAGFTIAIGITFTLSRGGSLALAVGIAAATWYYSLSRQSASALLALVVSGVLAAIVVGYAGFGSQLVKRLDSLSDVELVNTDTRLNHWIQTSGAIADFVPFGSGVGSYVNVHRLYRVDSEDRIFYHAENQYFQTLVEAGVPGLLLLLAALFLLGRCVRFIGLRGNSPKTSAVCVFGVFLLSSQMVAAIFDFGLFIPANTTLMALAAGFLAGQAHALADRLRKQSAFRAGAPLPVTMVVLLAVFATAIFSLLSCLRYANIERVVGSSPATDSYQTLNLATTDERIDDLKTHLDALPDSAGLTRLAELYMFRYRARLFDELVGSSRIDVQSTEAMDNAWTMTSITRLHGLVYQAWDSGVQQRVDELTRDPLVRENLLPAVYYLKLSRSRSPLQPAVHLLLGQLHGVSPRQDSDVYHLQRSLELAPANAVTAFVAGILDLQAGRLDSACRSLKKCLQIEPSNYVQIARVTVPYLPAERIVQDVLPDDPLILYDFATTYLSADSAEPLKLDVFQKVDALLVNQELRNQKSLRIKVEVQKRLGNLQGASETLERYVDLFPEILGVRYQLAVLYLEQGQLSRALEVARYLLIRDRDNVNFQQLLQRIRKRQDEVDFPG